MKNYFKSYLFSFFVLFLFSTSCSLFDNVCKDGKGNVISQPRTVSKFTAIESRGNFKVNLFQDSSIKTQTITISAQENIIDLIQTRISGQSLIIDADECYNTTEEITITVRTPALSQIILTGSGDILLQDTTRISNVELILNGSGNMRNASSFPIIATNCTAKLKGSGNMELDVKVTTKVNASVDGSGTIILRGTASAHGLHSSGSGNIKAFSLPVLTSTAEIIGSGGIEMTVIDTINISSQATVNAQISGSGQISIKGNATIKSNISGSGKIEQVD